MSSSPRTRFALVVAVVVAGACPDGTGNNDVPGPAGTPCTVDPDCASGRCGTQDGVARVCVDVDCTEDIDCFGGICVDADDCGAYCTPLGLDGDDCTLPLPGPPEVCAQTSFCEDGLECSVIPEEPTSPIGDCHALTLGQGCVPAGAAVDGCVGGTVCDGVTETCAIACDAVGSCNGDLQCSTVCPACVARAVEGEVCYVVAPYDGDAVVCAGAQRPCEAGLECGVAAVRGADVDVFACAAPADAIGAPCNPSVLADQDGCIDGLVCQDGVCR